MTAPPEHLFFEFELDDDVVLDPHGEPPPLLEVVGRCRFFSGANVVYQDTSLPVAELALQLAAWCERVASEPQAFSYDSRVSAFPGLIRLEAGYEGWRLSSVQQELPSGITHPLADVLGAARDFVARVEAAVQERLGRSIHGLA